MDTIVDRFGEYLSEKHFAWWSVLHDWKRTEISIDEFRQFNPWADEHDVFTGVQAFVPVVCTNGPIHVVGVGAEGMPEKFDTQPFAVGSARMPNWPSVGRGHVLQSSSLCPLVVTNPTGILDVLSLAFEWHRALKEHSNQASGMQRLTAYGEAAFVRAARERFREGGTFFSSNTAIEQWL